MKETPEEQYNAFWKEIIEDDESRSEYDRYTKLSVSIRKERE
jgi:hypothetical protein